MAHVRQFLQRCFDERISQHKDKFKFCECEIAFAWFKLSREGYKVNDSLLNAIRNFPLPIYVTDLRSFFGLANQLASNTAAIVQRLQPLRPLSSTKNDFVWGADHTKAFKLAKESLTQVPILSYFDTTKLTKLMTNASCKGLGFVLQQMHGDKWRIIQAGSRFLSDTETRYVNIEKEMLGVTWAVLKCQKISGWSTRLRDH